jgi:hypothetical protein
LAKILEVFTKREILTFRACNQYNYKVLEKSRRLGNNEKNISTQKPAEKERARF